MGVFDYITFEAGIEGCPFNRFQTKDLAGQWLDEYYVTPEGLLMHQVYETESVPPEERPYPVDHKWHWIGGIRRVNVRLERELETGIVEFYGDGFDGLRSIGLQGQGNQEFDPETESMVPAVEREFFRYQAEFKDGQLVRGPWRVPE